MINKTKYNVTLVMLLVVIGMVAGLSTGFMGTGTTTLPDIVVPDDDGGNEMPTGKFTPPSADAGPYTKINFALKVLEEGEGFMAESSSTVISMGVTQNVFSRMYRTGKEDTVEEWQHSASSMAKNEFSVRYSNENNVNVKKLSNQADYSFSNKDYNAEKLSPFKNYSANDYKASFKRVNDFPITINSETANVLRNDKTSNKNYYIIVLMVNTSKVDKEYINGFVENGTQGVNFSLMRMTFYINKKTGFLQIVEREENFKTTFAGLNINCEAKMKLEFKAVNTSQKTEIGNIKAKAFA